MRKVLLISAIALAVAGCANQEYVTPQVRDLSVSRESSSAGHYTVEPGDTLYGIAWRHDMDYRDLARLNQVGPPYNIEPGQELRLNDGAAAVAPQPQAAEQTGGEVATATALGGQPSGQTTDDWLLPDEQAIERNRRLTAEPLDGTGPTPSETALASAENVAPTPPPVPPLDPQPERQAQTEPEPKEPEPQQVPEPEPQQAPEPEPEPQTQPEPQADAGTQVAGEPERQPERDTRTYTPVAEVPWEWPADGELVGRFSEGGSITAGIDIAGQKGQPVRAAGPGIVVFAGGGVRGYGNLILLKHNDQFLSAYAHNDALQVTENDVVEAGQVIASMGDSDAESVRLHFEVRKDGQPQDPLEFLPQR